MQTWMYVATAGGILAIFFIFLSGIIKERIKGVILMFVFTLFASAALVYGVYNAHLEAKENLGKPIQELEEGDYEIFWAAQNTQDGKVYLIADKIEDPPEEDIRFYRIDSSDSFLKKMQELLKSGQGMRLRMEENGDEGAEPELYPSPPEPLPPKP